MASTTAATISYKSSFFHPVFLSTNPHIIGSSHGDDIETQNCAFVGLATLHFSDIVV